MLSRLTAQINPPLLSRLLGFLGTGTQECRTIVGSGLLWKLEHRNRKKTSLEIIWLPWNRNAEPNMAFFET
jgi:hypothetical protein